MRWQGPRFVHKLGKFKSPTPRPLILHRRHSDYVIIKEIFHHHAVSIDELNTPRNHELNPALRQITIEGQNRTRNNIKHHSWMLTREPVNDRQHRAARRILAASDAKLT